MTPKNTIATLLTAGLIAATGPTLAGEKPPAGALPLSEIVKTIEDKGYTPITEVSIENGVWEIEAYKGEAKRELKVSPADAEIITDRPDD